MPSSLISTATLRDAVITVPFWKKRTRNKQAQERGRSWGEAFGVLSTQGTEALLVPQKPPQCLGLPSTPARTSGLD